MPKVSKRKATKKITDQKLTSAQKSAKKAESLKVCVKGAFEDYKDDFDIVDLLKSLKEAATIKGFSQLARETKLSRQYLYEIFSKQGNPTVKVLEVVLKSFGHRITFQPITKK
ncbi:MAG: helix-turn-helix domain-containing protein [Pseudomonadota bacterium]